MDLNFNYINITAGIQNLEDALKSLEFEKEKYIGLIKQIDQETEEFKSKTSKLKEEAFNLNEKKIEYYSKLDLFRSISSKLMENIERTSLSKKLTSEKLSNLKNDIEKLEIENGKKLLEKKLLIDEKLKIIEKKIDLFSSKSRSSFEIIEKVQALKEWQLRVEQLKDLSQMHLEKTKNQKLKYIQDWTKTKKKIVEIASLYKRITEIKNEKEKGMKNEFHKNGENELKKAIVSDYSFSLSNDRTSRFNLISDQNIHTKNDQSLFLKPRELKIEDSPSNNNHLTSIMRYHVTSTPLPRFQQDSGSETIRLNQQNLILTPIIPKVNPSLNPILKTPNITNKYRLKFSKHSFEMTTNACQNNLENLEEEPISNNMMLPNLENFLLPKTHVPIESVPFNFEFNFRNLNKTINEEPSKEESNNEMRFGFQPSHIQTNKKPIDSLNLFKE